MLSITITPEMYRLAWAKSRDYKKQKIDRPIHEILGDMVYLQLKNDVVLYDVKVKTKQCDYEPLSHHECSVHKSELYEDFDSYAFVRINNDCSRAWYLGEISKLSFFGSAQLDKNFYKLKIGELNG